MFAARYETYAISLYADEAANWKQAMKGRWHDKVEGMELTLDTGKKVVSMPADMTNDPSISAKADVIILAVPSFAHGQYFEAFYPYIKPGTIVACMPARSGGDILFASKMKEKADSLAFVGFEHCRHCHGHVASPSGAKGPRSSAPRARFWLLSRRRVSPPTPSQPSRGCWASFRRS